MYKRLKQFISIYNLWWITLLPSILIILILIILPGVLAVSISSDTFRSFRSYCNVLSDFHFWIALKNSIIYTTATVSLQLFLGVISALGIYYQRNKCVRILLIILFFLPYAIPSVVAALSWRFLLKQNGTIAKTWASFLNTPENIWMGDWILVTLIVISVWQFYPFVFISILARLRKIPINLFRIAQIDGANIWQQFWVVILPEIQATVITIICLRVAFMFTKFDTPWLIIGSTANKSAMTLLPVYIYDNLSTSNTNRADAWAAAILLSIFEFIIIASILLLRRIMRPAETA